MTWTEDGSGNLIVSGEEVKHIGSEGKKANALWSKGGTGSWEFRISGQSGIWIGVSSPAKFGAGYGMKGLFYGGPGNLSDGSSLVAGQWGPKFEDGDVIGMRLEQLQILQPLPFLKTARGRVFHFIFLDGRAKNCTLPFQ